MSANLFGASSMSVPFRVSLPSKKVPAPFFPPETQPRPRYRVVGRVQLVTVVTAMLMPLGRHHGGGLLRSMLVSHDSIEKVASSTTVVERELQSSNRFSDMVGTASCGWWTECW
jgi:hypothetical protein